MSEPIEFDAWTRALEGALREREDAVGLVLLGSTVAAHRRD